MSTEETIRMDVLPGDWTGSYYITMCNLPFLLTWYNFNDWLRAEADCEVSHTEIFQSSTSGWVCLKGKDNFEKAWTDDKNRTQTISIRKVKRKGQKKEKLPPPVVVSSQMETSRPAAQRQQVVAALPAASSQYSSVPEQYYAAGYNQAGGPSYSGQYMLTQGYGQQPYTYSGADAGPSSGAGYPPNYQAQFALPYPDQQAAMAYYGGAGAGAGGGVPEQEPAYQAEQDYVATQARKLHVSPFPQDIPPEKVRTWIQHKIYEKQTIKSIEVPMNTTGKYVRGHAFVIFENASAAAKAMEQLNKTSYQGRRIIARPTVEGVALNEPSSSEAPRANRANFNTGQARIPTGPRGDNRPGGDRA
ncbi:hypothetical protein N0V84_002824 [Fusarium piperis]|uniref:RRM domain-containing protein n=1 Tax=Fusarium piperis TaxID=1435070 RepID=A0A9W9BS07_9HYPO|nr:hypothetical protein N0V84_002824 [Fusarium piperis]